MEVKICKNCKKLFNYIFGPEVCPICAPLILSDEENVLAATLAPDLTAAEKKYREVRDYAMKHPKATILEIAQATNVTATQILDWVREERLEFSEDCKYAWFNCELCGVKIPSGRYCIRCKSIKRY